MLSHMTANSALGLSVQLVAGRGECLLGVMLSLRVGAGELVGGSGGEPSFGGWWVTELSHK